MILDKASAKKQLSWKLYDLIVFSFFMLYAIAMFLGRWKGLPSFEFLESDIANSAGMAAAKLRPDLFHGDALLGDSRNIDFYHVAQTPLMQWIANLTGNFGTAAVVLLIPHVFFQLSGFYILGKVLFNDRIWAIFLTFLTAQYVHLNIGDFWGLYFDIMPRFLFQALLPFFLAAAIYYRNLPKTWPIILFLFGPMMYAHPVSTPSCALAIWLGFFAVLPSKWSYRRKVSQMFLSGFCFLISASPFLINYLGSHQHGATTNFSAVMEIMKWRFDPAFFNIPQAVQGHFQTGFKSVGYYYGVLATIPLLILCLYRRKNLRTLSMILLWIIGLAFTSIVIPFIEQEICNYYKIAPLEVDLLRNTRYLVPIFMLILLWTLFELAKLPLYWRRSHLASGIKLFVTLLAAVVSLNHHGPVEVDPLKNTFNSWIAGKFIPKPEDKELAAVINMQAVRDKIPEGSKVFISHGLPELAIRYSGLRPIVYCYKDGGAFAYSNHQRLLEWAEETKEFKAAFNAADPLFAFYKMAKRLKAEYLVVGFDMQGEKLINSQAMPNLEIIYESRIPLADIDQTRTFAILKIIL